MKNGSENPCKDLNSIPYDLELNKILDFIKRSHASRIILQSPPGLKKFMPLLAECIEKLVEHASVMVSLEGSYGACDLVPEDIIKALNADLVIHFGHTPYPRDLSPGGGVRPNYLYVPAYSKLSVSEEIIENLSDILRELGAKKVGLLAVIQHVKELERLANYLKDNGFKVFIPPGAPPFFLEGQVLGCDYRLALYIKNKVDAYVIISGGKFHPLGLYLSTRKPVVKLDLYENRAKDFTKEGEKVLKVRMYKVMEALDVKSWGVIVGTKTGQYRPRLVKGILSMLKKRGLKYTVFASGELNEKLLDDLSESVDGFVITSCPRLAIDDLSDYRKPVLTPGEFRMAIEKRLNEYIFPW